MWVGFVVLKNTGLGKPKLRGRSLRVWQHKALSKMGSGAGALGAMLWAALKAGPASSWGCSLAGQVG